MVVEADEHTGVGRVSCRIDGKTTILEMSLADIGQKLSSQAKMTLDSIGAATSKARVEEHSDGWFFQAREGLQGPFASSEEAEKQLDQHMLVAQSA